MAFTDDVKAVKDLAASYFTSATGFLQKLQDQANTLLIQGTTILPEQYDYATVPQVNVPIVGATRPTLTGLNLASPPTAPVLTFAALQSIVMPTDDLIAPPSGALQFAEAPYQSILLDPLRAKLLDNLLNGGYGIEVADEIALFNRARDREVEAMMSRVADAGRGMAARGFPLPPGELQIHIDMAYQGMQDKVSDASRDITLTRNKDFVENRKFTITEVRELEQVTMNYWNAVQQRALEAAKSTVEMAILVYNALVNRYNVRLQAAKITADVNIAQAQTNVAQAQAAAEVFRSQITAYDAQLRAVLEPARLQVDAYGKDVELARTLNDAFVASRALQIKTIEATVQENIQISTMTIENARVRLEGLVKSIGFRTAALEYGSKEFFAALSSLLSTTNTLSVQTTPA